MNYNKAEEIGKDAFIKLNKAKLYCEGKRTLRTESLNYHLPKGMELTVNFEFDRHTGMWLRHAELADSNGFVLDCIRDEGIDNLIDLVNTIYDVCESVEEEITWKEKIDKYYNYPGFHNNFESVEECGAYWDAMEMGLTDSVYDVDRYIHLMELFGYDIGLKAAHDIEAVVWEKGFDVFDLGWDDKEFVEKICKDIHLGFLDFRWWCKSC